MTRLLRLGVIGLSEGNGHPYSWSAIVNGYDPAGIENCGFPLIPQYLAERSWPKDRLSGCRVTHVWTQERSLSDRIARACRIETVVDRPEEMIPNIDALLLARDDADQHHSFAEQFLKEGLPVYVDKPVAFSLAALDRLLSLQRYEGQIFSCSALRFAEELALTPNERVEIGTVQLISAITPKSWRKYAVHIVEPVLRLPDCAGPIEIISAGRLPAGGGCVTTRMATGTHAVFTASGERAVAPIAIRYCGETGTVEKYFRDSFTAFRAALQSFIEGISGHLVQSPRNELRRVVEVIEAGCNA